MFKRKETRAFLYSICLFCIVIFICRFSAVNIKADDTIGRAEWLHRLTETFVMTVDEDNYPDNYFSDLDSGSEYYRDVMVAVEFGVVDIEAGEAVEPEKPVTREFAAHTLNYCLGYQLEGEPENKHYTFSDASQCQFPDDAQISVDHECLSLVNGKFLPEQNVTAAEVENMLSGAANIIKTTIIDENADSNYVFAENVVVFPKGTDVSINENDVVTVSSAKAIREGDTFVVYPADLPCLFRAKSVESNGDGNMVITTEEADEESAVVSIDSEGIADVDLSQFESAENVNAEYIRTAAQARDASQAYGIEVGKDSVVADTSISLGNGAKVKLAMNLSGLRLSHDIKTLRRYYYVSLEGNMNATGTLVSDAAKMALASKSVTLGSVRVAGVGKISITAEITAEGKIIVQYNGGFQTGFQSEQGKFRLLCKFHKKNFSSSVEAEASIALKASAGIDLIVVKGSLYMQAGINAKMTSDDYNDEKAPRNCTHIAAWLSADGGAKVTVGIGLLKKDLFNKHTDIFVYKNSPVRLAYHFEDRISVSACTRGKDYKYFTDALSRYGSCSYGDASSSETGADGKPYTIYTYTLDEDENATITGYRGNVSVLSIPETLDGYQVTAIGKDAFKKNTLLGVITIPNAVISIGSAAFAECSNLSYVVLPKGLQTMGAFAFYNCDQLTEIEIPKSLKETTNDYYPDYHYGYVDGPFYGCDGLKKIVFEEGTTKVANGLFAYCLGIEEITIPDTVTMIGNNAFGDCVSLRTVRFGTGVTEIDKNAFIRDKQIAEITMTDSITKVASGVFAECEGLNKVTLSKALQTMGAFAFYNCDQLTEIEIPKSLKETTNDYYPGYHYGYVNGPFYGCDGLKNVTFETGTLKVANGLFAYCTGIENITIPDTVEQVENVAFYSCTLLKKVSMADSVKALGLSVFNGCSSLSEINLSKQITHIPNEAFRECAALETLVIPEGVTRIGDHAFRNAGVKAIELPTAMEWIGESAFEGAHVEQVIIKDAPANIRKSAFRNCASLSKVELGKKVKEIGEYVFDNCDAMTDISLPDSVSVLGRNTFSASELLKNVSLGNGITKIPERAFYECPSLESIVLPYRVNTIDNEAFVNCTSLKELTIPRKTTQIADTILSYPAQMTIYGVAGTYAEDYAGSKNMKFVGREIPAEEVVLSPAELTLNNGSTGALELSIVPNNFTDEVVWRSTNEDVATVTDTGIVEAKGIGTAAVNVTVGGLSAVCNVTVMQPVTAIYLSEDSLTMNALETHTLTADVSPETADNKAIEWSSSDEKVVTVDQNGLLTAVAKGTAAITAKALDGSGKEGSCSVTVRNNAYVVQSPSELESEHNYSNGCSDFWIYTLAGAESLDVTFHENTNIEEGFDYLYIYTGDGTEVGKYTGTALAGQTVTVAGDTVRIQLVSDDAGNAWGFKVAQIRNSSGEQIKIPQKITGTDIYTKSTEESQFKLDAVLVEGDGVLSYASDNEDVAAVSEDGTITIKGAGTAVITVTSSETELYQEAIKEIMLIVSSPDDHLHVLGQPEFVWTNDTASASLTCTECNMSVTLKTQVETNRIEPTCTQEGILSYMASVTVDGNVYSDKKEEIIPASGHTGGTADCGTQAVCDACSQMYGELNPENHTGDTEIRDAIDASCITVGYSGDVYCTKCGRIIASGTELPVTGHQFGSWTVVKAATYTAFGEEERSCSVCAEKETRTIEKLVRRSIRVKSIKITGIASKIAAGKKIKLTASVSPANASNKKITWKTSNIKVASVNANGVVTLKKNSGGKRVTITATAKDGSKVTARYTIISMKGSVKAVKISGKKTVKAGKTLKLKGKVTASKGANKKLKWSSSNKKYATVSSSGKVKALKAGKRKKVKITAAAMDGSGKKSSITIKIK